MDWYGYTKVAAYFLWENYKSDNALDLWRCAEDIACYFDQENIVDMGMVESIRSLGTSSEGYVWFIRNVAFRLHLYTFNNDDLSNWYLAEALLNSRGFLENVVAMAGLLREDRGNTLEQVRSNHVRNFYGTHTF